MSDVFEQSEVDRPFCEPVGDDKVRLNITLDRHVVIKYLKGSEEIEIDLLQMSPAEDKISRCFADGLRLFITNGIPSVQSVTQIDRPVGSQWENCKVTKSKKGEKSTFERKLTEDEKTVEADAHVNVRQEVLYGIREAQTRASNLNPLAEELRKIVAGIAVNSKSGLKDNEGKNWKVSSLPSVLCKGATNVATIEAAAASLGIGDNAVTAMKVKAQENVERAKLDDLLGEMDLSI